MVRFWVCLTLLVLLVGCARKIPESEFDGIQSSTYTSAGTYQTEEQREAETEAYGNILLAMVQDDFQLAYDRLQLYRQTFEPPAHRITQLAEIQQRLELQLALTSGVDTAEAAADSHEFVPLTQATDEFTTLFLGQIPLVAVLLDMTGQYFPFSRDILQGILAAAEAEKFSFRLINTATITPEALVDLIASYRVVIGPLRPDRLAVLEPFLNDPNRVFIFPTIANNPAHPNQYSVGLSIADEIRAIKRQMLADNVQRYISFAPDDTISQSIALRLKNELAQTPIRLYRERTYSPSQNNQSALIREFRGRVIGQSSDREKFATYSTDFDGAFLPGGPLDALVVVPQFPFYNFNMNIIRLYGTSFWQTPKLLEAAPHIYGAKFPTTYLSNQNWLPDVSFRHHLASVTDQLPSTLQAQGYDAGILAKQVLTHGIETLNNACFLGVTGLMCREAGRHVKFPFIVEVTRGGFRLYDAPRNRFEFEVPTSTIN